MPAVTLIDRVPWCAELLAGGPTVTAGKLTPPMTPGLGVTLNTTAAKYLVV